MQVSPVPDVLFESIVIGAVAQAPSHPNPHAACASKYFRSNPMEDKFKTRNWWLNGAACKILVVSTILCVLNLFQPWSADFAGTTSDSHFYYWTTFRASGTAFGEGTGWVLLPCYAIMLWVCGRPRAFTTGLCWLPLILCIVIFACSQDVILKLTKEYDAWVATFHGTKPIVTLPVAVQWTRIFSVVMAIAAIFFGRSARSIKVAPDAPNAVG